MMRISRRGILSTGFLFSGGRGSIAQSTGLPRPRKARGGRWGYVDDNDCWVVGPIFDRANPFTGTSITTAKFISNSPSWVFVDRAGQTRPAPLPFDDTYPFSEELVAFRSMGLWGLAERSGRVVVQPTFGDELRRAPPVLREGLAAVFVPRTGWGYIDQNGRMVITPKYMSAGSFSERLAPVEINSRCGFIDRSGRMAIPAQFGAAYPFKEGLAPVSVGLHYGFISRTGRIVIRPQYEGATFFSDGIAGVKTATIPGDRDRPISGQWSIIDRRNHVIGRHEHSDMGPFSEGLALVVVGGLRGFIDRTGRTVIEPQYWEATDFSNGVSLVRTRQEEWFYIDYTGRALPDPGCYTAR